MTYNLTRYDKDKLFKEFEEYLEKKHSSEHSIPISILSADLSPFESVVKYLVENLGMGYSQIGKILKKDRQVIWTTYKRASRTLKPHFLIPFPAQVIPVERLSSDKCSIAELLVGYLKDDLGMKNSQISKVMKRDQRTIWTLYNRFKKKNEDNERV